MAMSGTPRRWQRRLNTNMRPARTGHCSRLKIMGVRKLRLLRGQASSRDTAWREQMPRERPITSRRCLRRKRVATKVVEQRKQIAATTVRRIIKTHGKKHDNKHGRTTVLPTTRRTQLGKTRIVNPSRASRQVNRLVSKKDRPRRKRKNRPKLTRSARSTN